MKNSFCVIQGPRRLEGNLDLIQNLRNMRDRNQGESNHDVVLDEDRVEGDQGSFAFIIASVKLFLFSLIPQ